MFKPKTAMTNEEILSRVDHTLLTPTATFEQIDRIARDAIEYHTASICIPQTYVRRIHDIYQDQVNICTVVGFPLGYNSTASKIKEVEVAISDGANEIDMVINICDVKNRDFAKVEEEIRQIKQACGSKILKVIVETCYLDEQEKIELCKVVTAAKADYIKTSTGFGTGGATFRDIELFKRHIGPDVKIKAAGGISSYDDLKEFVRLGCDRLGTSRAINIIKGIESEGY
ncbi:MAG: deoxyribose-phosphate aldolase [Erysipelotrichaceae bacterium]|nr:deoxyribose-phosphate aldolase [Erysipelotrichaceae bacterium]MDD3809571.1 deoxyribose-phosphate aldolase [Erysipelotrichaceae bacterium]